VYELKVRRSFAAAHQLRGYAGKCESLHGHNYIVEVTVRADRLNDIGLAVDFKDIKTALDALLDRFDHSYLNDLEPFTRDNPSAENIAAAIYRALKPVVPAPAAIAAVTVWESDDSAATYWE
jgi:6-pyruvoyltetrahydropterin/6-carboxytetrahydropterin synthase